MSMEIKDGVLSKYTGKAKKVVVPADVTRICDWAFYDEDCPCLREIIVEGYKTVIEEDAFSPEPIDTWTIVLPDGYFEQTEELDAGTIIYLLKNAKYCKDYGVGLSITVTIRDYAALLLFQTDQKLHAFLEKEAGKSANNVVKAMTELLQEKGDVQHYVKAAQFAAGYPKKVSKKTVKELYNAAQAAKADDAVQLLEDSFWDIQ